MPPRVRRRDRVRLRVRCERRRDVAALRLTGISRRSVVTAVVIEAALIALVGSGLGAVVGWLGSIVINWHYRGLYRTPLAFSIITPRMVGTAVGLSIVLKLKLGVIWLVMMPLRAFGPEKLRNAKFWNSNVELLLKVCVEEFSSR